jgi:hypothetical protein
VSLHRSIFLITKWVMGVLCLMLIVELTVSVSIVSADKSRHGNAPLPAKVSYPPESVTRLGNLALSFEDSRGWAPGRFDFLSRGRGATLAFNYSGATIVLQPGAENSRSLTAERLQATRQRTRSNPTTMQLKLVGASTRSRVEKKDQLPGKSNYLIGNNPRRWRTNLPNYGRVSYGNIYPGIDVTYYGNGLQLEYDFTVKPGANPAAIAIDFVGADEVEIDAGGNLKLRLGGREIVQRRPFLYQEIRGVGRAISGKYVLRGGNRVGFEIGSYDIAKALVIDPVLVYSTYLGGSSSDQGISVALDSAGKAYVAGVTTSTDFPLSSGAAQPGRGGANDIFITKLNATGTAVVYSTYIGGSGNDEGLSLAVDQAGSAYITGFTDSADFPVTAGTIQTTRGGGTDAFVVKLNSLGTGFGYATYLGGSLDEEGYGLAVDLSGNAYVTGVTNSDNFPTYAAFQAVKNGGSDAFIAKLTSNGGTLSYSTFLGGDASDWAFAVTTDAASNVYVAGVTNSANFPVTGGSLQGTLGGPGDGFMAKITPSDTGPIALAYSTYLGGSGFDMCSAIALDEAGNAYTTGLTDSPDFPATGGAPQIIGGGGSDAFVSKLNVTGSTLLYSTYLGGSGSDWGRGIAVDTATQAYVVGSTESLNFPVVGNSVQAGPAGKSDAFTAKVNSAGTALTYSSYLGGTDSDDGFGIAADLARNVFVAGTTFSTNLPVTQGAFQTAQRGAGDAFLAKVSRQEATQVNQIDNVSFFVSQHYLDFLSRHPDPAGLAFWSDQITSCGSDQQCAEVRRINVSAAFFLSIEFQQTGYLVYRFNKASFNAMPRYELFLPDTQQIARGVIVNAPGWEELLATNQRAFAEMWVARPAFRAIYDAQSNTQYVDSLFANAGVVPGIAERTALIEGLNGGTETRATVLRKVADNQILFHQESNRAFVLEQYFGYLRRNPDDEPDGNLDGFNFWLNKLNEFNGNFVNAEMVKAFITSGEYRHRFGP